MKTLCLLAILAPALALAADETVAVALGQQTVVDVPGLVRISVEKPAIADVKTIGGDQILVIGTGEGETILHATLSNGASKSWKIVVKPPHALSELPDDAELNYAVGDIASFDASGYVKFEIARPEVAAVKLADGRLTISAKAVGRTGVLLFTRGGKPRQLSVNVEGDAGELVLGSIELASGSNVTLGIDGLSAVVSGGAPKVVGATVDAPGRLTLKAVGAGQAPVRVKTRGGEQTLQVVVR